MSAGDDLTEWEHRHPQPDAQQLAERYGGYSKVPVEHWSRFDRLIVAWRKARMPYAIAWLATCEISHGIDLVPNDPRLRRVSG
jgi:hypothetical protein